MTSIPHLGTARQPAGAGGAVFRHTKRWAAFASVLLGLALPETAMASDRGSHTAQPPAPKAAQAVERLSERLVGIVNDGSKDTAARERALAATLRAELDFETLTHFVLGRYATDLGDAQKQTFRRAFSDYVVGTYARVLARNSIATMTVVKSRKVTADTAAVATHVEQRYGEDARWVWRMHRRDSGHWRVVDLQTPTTSLAVNYRSELGNLLDHRGFDALIDQIRSHTERETVLPVENRAILMLIRGMQANRLALTAR